MGLRCCATLMMTLSHHSTHGWHQAGGRMQPTRSMNLSHTTVFRPTADSAFPAPKSRGEGPVQSPGEMQLSPQSATLSVPPMGCCHSMHSPQHPVPLTSVTTPAAFHKRPWSQLPAGSSFPVGMLGLGQHWSSGRPQEPVESVPVRIRPTDLQLIG